ncbi:molybdopterin-synthase adenylyltransferase MoeB [Paraglaciecola aquimarina]|uniref:Molybdopterin-synthase adenylyltransferase MoeB n=1 Tax=Paraglaciecola aquimarina TaxID=1235557 RepID=A0ABU3SZW2_9ALTE|nr:molybdopterin-synthase adenylyltransferase MoeB [Paraglaciecola aquimarina]MDU0355502.1 molybdopterin-synthase adenylyltransferase MoeB [Paraglaciecola aquimarina]
MSEVLTTQQALRYNRQISLAGFDLDKQEKLLNSRVLLFGVGGLGCAAAQYLVAAGVGNLILVDDDLVDYSNLQRQVLHGEHDVGRAKCDSAEQSLKALNSECNIQTIKQRLEQNELPSILATTDVIVDCTDNLATRDQLNRASVTHNIPLISGAAIRMEGQVASFVPSAENACYHCLSVLFAEQQLSCVEAGIMSPVVGIIGSMQALETIKVLADFAQPLVNTLMMFDGNTSQWQRFKIPKNKKCSVCSCR